MHKIDSRIKYKVDEVKRSNSNTIFLNAGDFFQARAMAPGHGFGSRQN
jgi:2',3'-cyclic-nucleotide 2'-phosphodiesterase (5'-nucleotidase family)